MKVLDLSQEFDNLVGDVADDLDLGKVLLHARCGLFLHIVQPHDLVLDIEVELPPEEAAQVFVDEVVEGVPSRVVKQVLVKNGLVGLRATGSLPLGGEALLPNRELLSVQVLDDAPGRLSIDDVLPTFFTVGAVLKADDKFAVFLGHRLVAVQYEASVVTVGCLDVVLLGVRLDNLEVHAVSGRCLEGIITEVFSGLDVILVVVGPV